MRLMHFEGVLFLQWQVRPSAFKWRSTKPSTDQCFISLLNWLMRTTHYSSSSRGKRQNFWQIHRYREKSLAESWLLLREVRALRRGA